MCDFVNSSEEDSNENKICSKTGDNHKRSCSFTKTAETEKPPQ